MVRVGRAQVILGLLGILAIAVVAVLGVAMARGVGGANQGRSTEAPREAPAFRLDQFTGGSFELVTHAGRPVFVYYWASWCIPCEQEAPLIERLWPEYRDRGWVFVGVNIWDAESDARRFADRHRLTFPLVRDVEGKVYLDYGVQALPTAFFLNPGQQIYARYDGLLSEERLRGLLDEAELPRAGAGLARP